MPRKKTATKIGNDTGKNEKIKVRCTMCGKETINPEGKFYRLSYSDLHKANNHWSHICSSCINEEFRRLTNKYDQKMAAILICAYLNVPYYDRLFTSVCEAHKDDMTFGYYVRRVSNKQYSGKTFASTIIDQEFERRQRQEEEDLIAKKELDAAESTWGLEERRAKNEVTTMMGYDPFDGYSPKVRRMLFPELLGYLDDEELLNDSYRLSQVIQVVNNNYQINQCDIAISQLNPKSAIEEIKIFNQLKKELVASNEKIAKDNGISVKSKGNQRAGKGSLTGLMRDMRERGIESVNENYFNQLTSENSRWATNISMQSMMENCMFDENDVNDIIDYQRKNLEKLQTEKDTLEEEKRLLKVSENELNKKIEVFKEAIRSLGGNVSEIEGGMIDV